MKSLAAPWRPSLRRGRFPWPALSRRRHRSWQRWRPTIARRDAVMTVDSVAGDATFRAVLVMMALVIESTLLGVSERFASVPAAASMFDAYWVRPALDPWPSGRRHCPGRRCRCPADIDLEGARRGRVVEHDAIDLDRRVGAAAATAHRRLERRTAGPVSGEHVAVHRRCRCRCGPRLPFPSPTRFP